jgi:signal transduction histidine kinase
MDKITDRPKILKISTRVRKEFFLEVEEDSVVVEISDTGSGMDEVTVFNLFKPFFTTKSPGEGTGLGLALVEKYIKAHGGLVSVESRVGEGTTFIIKLPLSPKNDQLQE